MSYICKIKKVFFTLTALWIFLAVEFVILISLFQKSSYQYSNFLSNIFVWSCTSIFVLLLIFMLAGFVFFLKFDHDCIENWMIFVWIAFIIASFIWLQYQFYIFNEDIQNEDFVVYEGEFEKDTTRGFIFLDDNSSTRIYNTDETFLEAGRYSGKLVYSKRTKYVLSYVLDSCKNTN